MTQSKATSAFEAVVGTVIGFIVALLGSFFIYPALGMHEPHKILIATAFFTVLSIIRTYYVRRLFEKLGKRGIFNIKRKTPNHG